MKRRISSEDRRSPSPDPRAVVEKLDDDHNSVENDSAEDDRPSQPRMQGRESPQTVHIYQQYAELVPLPGWGEGLISSDPVPLSDWYEGFNFRDPAPLSEWDEGFIFGEYEFAYYEEGVTEFIFDRDHFFNESPRSIAGYLSQTESSELSDSEPELDDFFDDLQNERRIRLGGVPQKYLERIREQLTKNTILNSISVRANDVRSDYDVERYGPGENILLPMILQLIFEKDKIKNLELKDLMPGCLRDVKNEILSLNGCITALKLERFDDFQIPDIVEHRCEIEADADIIIELLSTNKTIRRFDLDYFFSRERLVQLAAIMKADKVITHFTLRSFCWEEFVSDYERATSSVSDSKDGVGPFVHFIRSLEENTTITSLAFRADVDRNSESLRKEKQALAQLISRNKFITELKAQSFKWQDEDCRFLAAALKENTTLIKLDLRDMRPKEDRSFAALAEGLEENNSLQSIWLCSGELTDKNMAMFAKILEKNTTLLEINGRSRGLAKVERSFRKPPMLSLDYLKWLRRSNPDEYAVVMGLSRNRLLLQANAAALGATMMLGFQENQPGALPFLNGDVTQQIAHAVINHLPADEAERVLGEMRLRHMTQS